MIEDSKTGLWHNIPLRILVIGIAYFVSVQFSLFFVVQPEHIAAFWLPNGIYASSLLLNPRKLWGFIIGIVFISNFLGNAIGGNDTLMSLGFALANVAEGWCIAAILARGQRTYQFKNTRSFAELIVAVLIGTSLGALLGATHLSLNFGWHIFMNVAKVWFIADCLGNAIMIAFIMSWLRALSSIRKLKARRILEALAILVFIVLITIIIFTLPEEYSSRPYNYLVFPFLTWAALRFDIKATALILLVTSCIAAGFTIQGKGPFIVYGTHVQEYMIWLQIYLGIIFLTSMILALTVNELKHNEKQLLVTTQMLRQSNEELENFAYRTSHDLKAPLSTIQGYCSLVQSDLEDNQHDQISDYMDRIGKSSKRLSRLVDDILILSRANYQDEAKTVIDLPQIVEEIKDSLQSYLEHRTILFQTEYNHHRQLHAQKTRIRQSLENLLSNAIKYSDPNKPESRVIISTRDLSDGRFELEITDNGLGINHKQKDKLFQMFFRAHKQSAEGSGLGLYIVKRHVERMGGNIKARSEESVGSIFTITLPNTPTA